MWDCTWGDASEVWMTEGDYRTIDQAQKAMDQHLKGHELAMAQPQVVQQVQGDWSRIPKGIAPKIEM